MQRTHNAACVVVRTVPATIATLAPPTRTSGSNADEDFETKIVVKTNMPEVLRQELRKPSWTRERVAIGTATDAYQPCEGRYRLTRRCLEALRDA